MDDKEKQLLRQIKNIHSQILKDYKNSLNRCIKLGGILQSQKELQGHGNFLQWVKTYLPFAERTARNYMALYRHRDTIRQAKIESIKEAYLLISNYNCHIRDINRNDLRKHRKEIANGDSQFKNPSSYIDKIVCGDCRIIMQKMLQKGMGNKYSAILTSPPYNSRYDYGSGYNDDKSYGEYLDFLLEPFPLYLQLLREGGRIIYIIGNMCKNYEKQLDGDYNYQLLTDLTYNIREKYKDLKHYTTIIWNKGSKGQNPLNTRWGSFCSPLYPVNRSSHENIIIWSKNKFELENESGQSPDISEKDFKEWSWSVWTIAPYSYPSSPNPCSFAPKLVERLLKFFTFPQDMILDPFGGAGTTAIVARKLKRRFTMIELNSNYCSYAAEKLR